MPLGNPIRKQNESRMVSVLATEGQTVFTVQGGYIINHISVFRNGVRLSPAEDFTAGDGSTVTLNNAANIDDRIDFHIFDRFTVQNAIIGAASTQTINGDLVLNGKLFGQLDVPSINLTGIVTATKAIIGTGVTIDQSNIDTVGIITATTFKGALTGAATRVTLTDQTGDTSCNVLFSQSATGDQLPHTNANLTYNSSSGALTATSVNGNIVGGTVSGTTGTFSSGLVATGIVTATDFSGAGGAAADFPNGLSASSAVVTGGITATGGNIVMNDSSGSSANRIKLGTSQDLELYHTGSHSFIEHSGTGHLILGGVPNGNNVDIMKAGYSEYMARFKPDSSVDLYYDANVRFNTTPSGADVTGTLNVTGISTFAGAVTVTDTINAKQGRFTDDGGSDPTVAILTDDSSPWAFVINNATSQNDTQHGYKLYVQDTGNVINQIRGSSAYKSFTIKTSNSSNSDDAIVIDTDRSVKLYHQGSTKLQTTSSGATITGTATATALTVNGGTTPATITHTGGNALHLTRSSKTLGFNANYGASDVKSQIDVSSGMALALSVADNEKIRMTSGGQLNLGGNFTQTSSALSIYGGSGGSGIFNGLEVKHANTSTSTGGGTGDGPAILLNGYYSSAEWQFAKICSVNSGSGFGADLQIHVHPSNGTQGASLVKAVSIVGNGTGGNITIHAGTLYTTYDGDSMYGAQINDSKTSGTHIQFQRQGYNNGNITHTTNSCAYNTTGSDRTLKKNFEDWTEDTLTLFKNLKPQKFNFTIEADGVEKTKGYIAQDLVDSFPEAYPKEVISDKYMFNPSGMVPYLMKALQEEIAKREALEARISALEGS